MYLQLGKIPHKRHTAFRKPDGSLYTEQLFGTEGFNGHSSLLYHIHRPTQIKSMFPPVDVAPKAAEKHNITTRKLEGFSIPPWNDFLESRSVLMFNNEVQIGLALPQESMEEYFYKNGDSDELLFIHRGTGQLHTLFGRIDFVPGDYLLIPRGCIYQVKFEDTDNAVLFIESRSPIEIPKRYLSEYGQFLEHAPFCERDLKVPYYEEPVDKKGDFLVKVKKQDQLHSLNYAYHPFDVVGWDGYLFPYGFSIYDFEPITGRIHQPPPVHQTFAAGGFVVCSFVPRLFDYHPDSIPAPYNHSNIDSEEILYYVDGDFMSRNNIRPGQFTLHPGGIPHGPHPGAAERSIGQKETNEVAVMIDTFNPLQLTGAAMEIEDPDYHRSWLEH